MELFRLHHPRLVRLLQRLTGDGELAADLVQEAFVRLHARSELPDAPEAWLVSVALNLLRNERGRVQRRSRLLTPARGELVLGDAPAAPEDTVTASELRHRVRQALDHLPERDRALLLLQAEGYAYREMAAALELNEASVGVFLARARRALRAILEKGGMRPDAP